MVMAKQKAEDKAGAIAPVEQQPAWLAGYEGDTGIDEMSQYKVVPRLKIKQSSSRDQYKDFPNGTVLISGTTQIVAERSQGEDRSDAFRVVPLFFFPEWVTMSDLKDKASNTILYRTTNENDPIVAKARDQKLRTEQYGDNDQFKMSHREIFNFMCVIVGEHPLAGSHVVMTFSRGEHRTGRQWCTYLFMRKSPIFGQIFEFSTSERHGSEGDWWGFDFKPIGWVAQDDFENLKEIHAEFKRLHAAQALRSGGDDDDIIDGAATAGEAAEDAGV